MLYNLEKKLKAFLLRKGKLGRLAIRIAKRLGVITDSRFKSLPVSTKLNPLWYATLYPDQSSNQNMHFAQMLLNLPAYQRSIIDYQKAISINKPKIAVYTAIVGNYDSIKLPQIIDPHFDYYVFTDQPQFDSGIWKIKPITYIDADPTRTARYVKTHPHHLLADYDLAVWLDSNIMINGDLYADVQRFNASGYEFAAVPHPNRQTLEAEYLACCGHAKDDKEGLTEQIDFYREQGFETTALIESNYLMFNLHSDRVKHFLTRWWQQIENFTRRDQMSINYALHLAELEWYQLTEWPHSVRDHAGLLLSPHDHNQGVAVHFQLALNPAIHNPYAGISFLEAKSNVLRLYGSKNADIVVCVHNALDEVRACLDSIHQFRNHNHHRIIIIDDGSGQETQRYLESFVAMHMNVVLERHDAAWGYTKSANHGLRLSSAELVILLNSDTVVTAHWIEKFFDALASSPGTGIVGPLSNAASYQSIPDIKSSIAQTAVNKLPDHLDIGAMNTLCESWTVNGLYPQVPLLHGFCFGVTRAVLNKIGLLDELNFPTGYGEETDFCIRAIDAGFSLVVATHTFIYHKKSRSFSFASRTRNMLNGSEKLRELHPARRIERAVTSLKRNPILSKFQSNMKRVFELS